MSAVITDQQTGPKVAEFFSPGPGERLRAARLSMGFDIGKVARELHLTTAIVERLEADDYEDVGARVFVRGYLRNYARLVDMPSDSILRQFDEKWPDDPPVRQSMLRESPRLPADGGPSRGWAGAITWLLVLGSIALFLMWWQGYLDGMVPDPIRTADVEVAATTDDPDPLPRVTASADEPPVSDNGSLRLPTLAPIGVEPQAEPVSESTELPVNTTAALPTLVPSTGDAEAEAESAVEEATAPAEGVAPTADAPLTQASSSADAAVSTPPGDGGAPVVDATTGIVMTFSAPCWVDVRDSSRKFKLFGEMPEGSRKVLGGEPPYKVVIGNARAVTIEVNGEPFDVKRFAKGNVARFTLDP